VGAGRFPKVIPAKTIVMTRTVTTNLFCFIIWDIANHVLADDDESNEWFNSYINSYQKARGIKLEGESGEIRALNE